MSEISQTATQPRWTRWTGWGMSGLMILFLLFDGISKLALEHHVVGATTRIGYPLDTIRPLGIICLVCTVLYAVPRTSILGAVLLTGYLGGAIASKVRIEDQLFSSVLFGVYLGIWCGAAFTCATRNCAPSFRCGGDIDRRERTVATLWRTTCVSW